MEVNTKVSGKMDKHVAKVVSGMRTETLMKDNGTKIKRMGMDYTCMPMVQNT